MDIYYQYSKRKNNPVPVEDEAAAAEKAKEEAELLVQVVQDVVYIDIGVLMRVLRLLVIPLINIDKEDFFPFASIADE